MFIEKLRFYLNSLKFESPDIFITEIRAEG